MAHIEGVADVLSALRAIKARVHQATADGVKDGALIVQGLARRNATVDPRMRTGRLVGSITTSGPDATGPSSYRAKTYPTVVYGRIIELGGVIVPVRARMLRWIGEDGKPIFARKVTIRPHPYLRPATVEGSPLFRQAIAGRWAKALEV